MIRWIVFDVETAEAVVSRFRRGAAEIHEGTAVTAALDSSRSSLLILPGNTPGKVILARCEPKSDAARSDQEISYQPGGFLGLSDEPTFNHLPRPLVGKKRWWQRKTA